MNQAEVAKLVSKLRINVQPKPRKLRSYQGPEGRLNKLRKTVTGLIKYERIELFYPRADEARQYTERLISEAIRHGDCHKPTMDIANYWLLEKELIHKLFKVLVPRYENYSSSYTRMYKAPKPDYSRNFERSVLELKDNPYPSLTMKHANNRQLLQNILLDAAKIDYRQSKYTEMAQRIADGETSKDDVKPSLENKDPTVVKKN